MIALKKILLAFYYTTGEKEKERIYVQEQTNPELPTCQPI